jgi:hypothetical protein
MAHQGGRPTNYKQEYCQMLIDHMAEGLSFEAFAGLVSVTKQTLYNWIEVHPEFLDAKKIATERCRLFWEKLGINHVVSTSNSTSGVGSESTTLNTGVYVFNMKNRFPEEWKDKKEVDNTHEFKNRPDWLDAAQ